MPSPVYRYKEGVIDWEYPEPLREIMAEFEAKVEEIRRDVAKADRNVSAGIRARKAVQEIRHGLGQRLRDAIQKEKTRVYDERHPKAKPRRRRRAAARGGN
jgi:hypothetical protein